MLYDMEMGRLGQSYGNFGGMYGNGGFYGGQSNFRYGAPGQPWPPAHGSYYGQQPYQQQYPMPQPMEYQQNYRSGAPGQPWPPTQHPGALSQPPVTPTAPATTPPVSAAPAGTSVPTAGTTPPAAAADTTASATNVAEKPAAALDAASGGKTATYGYRGQAPKATEIPNIAKNQVQALQQFLIDAGVNVGPTGADGKYGPNTHYALKTFAAQHGITDLSTVDFIGKNEQSQTLLKALGQGSAPAPAPAKEEPKVEVKAPTQAELDEQGRLANLAKAKEQYEAAERERPKITIDLPNDMKRGATIKKLLDGNMRGDDGERVEFNGPQGQNKEILKDYVKFVRDRMVAGGLDVGKGDSKETAALILAAYNGMSTTDQVRDLQTLRMPSVSDIDAALGSMSGNVLVDRKISGREMKLEAPLVSRVVFGEQVQLSSQVALSSVPEGQHQATPPSTPSVAQTMAAAPLQR